MCSAMQYLEVADEYGVEVQEILEPHPIQPNPKFSYSHSGAYSFAK